MESTKAITVSASST